MLLDPKDIKIETMRGTGPGGQHRNRTESCVRATHMPTGISVVIDTRKQSQSKKIALKELEAKVAEHFAAQKAAKKKAHRDTKIQDKKHIRTYDFKSQRVKDHRSGKSASIEDILKKGLLEKLR